MKTKLYSVTLAMLLFSVNLFGNTSYNKPLQIWTVGLLDYSRQEVMDRIARKYGFVFFSVSGCEVTKEMREKVKQHNEEVKAALSKEHGEGWWDRFQKEVNDILTARFNAEKLVRSQDEVINKTRELNSIKKDLLLYSEERGNGKYLIRVLGMENGEARVYYTYLVDLKNETVELRGGKCKPSHQRHPRGTSSETSEMR